MKFNDNQSVVLNFKGYKFKAKPLATLYLDGIMKTETSYKYLGHIIDNNLNDNKDIERQLGNFYGKSNMLLRTFSSCSYAVKLQLFMSYCGSMHTAILWCDFTKRQYRQLEVSYNNVCRKLMGYDKYCSASGMFVEDRTDGFDARVQKPVYGFRKRLNISDDSIIETVVNHYHYYHYHYHCHCHSHSHCHCHYHYHYHYYYYHYNVPFIERCVIIRRSVSMQLCNVFRWPDKSNFVKFTWCQLKIIFVIYLQV